MCSQRSDEAEIIITPVVVSCRLIFHFCYCLWWPASTLLFPFSPQASTRWSVALCPQWATDMESKAWYRQSTELPWRDWPCRALTGSRLMNGRASSQTGQRRQSPWGITQQRHVLSSGHRDSSWISVGCGALCDLLSKFNRSRQVSILCIIRDPSTLSLREFSSTTCDFFFWFFFWKVQRRGFVLVQPHTKRVHFVCACQTFRPLVSTGVPVLWFWVYAELQNQQICDSKNNCVLPTRSLKTNITTVGSTN